MSSATQPADVIADYEALWNGDFSKIDVVSESATVYEPAAPDGVVHGRDGFEAFLREVRQGFPDLTLETHDMLVRDGTVMLDFTVTGTFQGAYYGAPPTGRSMTLDGMAKTLITDGKIQEDFIYFDKKDMFDQLGMTFPDVLFLLPKMLGAKMRNLIPRGT